ncbi:MAG TPA: hypothetical protein PLZ74_00775 [Kiritimatiellia bacterium]|nr:hypothetical protein [Kiritimatiellia bacterium]
MMGIRMKSGIVLMGAVFFTFSAAFGGVWEKYAGNPVLGNAKLGTCFDVNVVTNGPAPYTMYFSWRPKKAIALVRSDDALSWTQEPEICLEADPTSGWEDDLNRSCTVFKDGKWHMWYTGQAKGGSKIGYATSADGMKFVRVRKDPVMVPENDFEKKSVMNPYVRWDAQRGVWRMWYAAGETYEPNVLCYAESKDGVDWKKWEKNPMFGKGAAESWDRDRVGGCETHPLPDGRWAMFYIGYSDIDTARIGCAISPDGVSDWKRIAQNPIIAPDLCTWDASACYKPSVLRDEKNNRWMLWYNGRNGWSEYVGMALHEGLDLEAPSSKVPDTKALLSTYVRGFNKFDNECVTNAIPNSDAERFLSENVPLFACPDKDIERTYYFRWWTFRKHLRHGTGVWTVSEFLPKVGWSGKDNTIVCPAGHHFLEGRWLRDPKYMTDLARFWLTDKECTHRWQYSSWLYTGVCKFAAVAGKEALADELLDAAVAYFERWEKGFDRRKWDEEGKGSIRMGGDGKGRFLSARTNEGTEFTLTPSGYRPLFNAAMWSEAHAISEVAARLGRSDLATRYAEKAAVIRRGLEEICWSPEIAFFVAADTNRTRCAVRELHGYAPWYFGVPTDKKADWSQLSDPQGFAAKYGLTFPERRAKGFVLAYSGHECQWNGPSWPFATSIALTALINDLHARPSIPNPQRSTFNFCLWQYAAQQKLIKGIAVPWIDENANPDKPDWISRTILHKRSKEKVKFERGKDYNHSTFCDLVISGLVGIIPEGAKGFTVNPLAPAAWDYFMLERLNYRGHEVSVVWRRGHGGLTVTVDGKVAARRDDLGRLAIRF